ncbi:hypothetical protein BDV28DRAFT_146641 [Aspergillus coremiiformis]|uniref:Uncharacterized protein n=1 Tax=Aspergillus coremiiformis TaxID=138285 RepID=A0A5N6ZB98_9EURO|nr:hypothetical protein BDV28DRAFT_146641 [Aspergillus coremiiformis]
MAHQMTKEDAERIQSTQARGGQDMSSSGFAARAQAAGDRNANTAAQTSSNQQGTGTGTGKMSSSQYDTSKSSQR